MVKDKKDFDIENNILRGHPLTCNFEDYSLGKMVLDSLNSEPHHVGQIDVDSGEQTTFAEMKERSVRCALWMKKQGIGLNDVVTICTNNQLDDYVPVLATLFVGAIYNPWYYGIDLPEARRLMHLLRPRIIFACESSIEVLLKAAKLERLRTKIVTIDRRSHLLSLQDILDSHQSSREIDTFRCTPIKDPRATSMILLSTGSAKCVERSAGSVAKYFQESAKCARRNRVVCLWYASFYWYCGTIYFLEAIINKNTRVMHDSYDHEDTCRVVDKFKVEILVLPLSLIKDLLRHNSLRRYDLSSLKCISIGGSYVSRDVIEELENSLPNVHIDNSYGLTEVGSRCNDPQRKRTKLGSIGFVKSNMEMKVIDPKTGETLGPNRIGELCFKSDTMMTGYYKDPEATRKVVDDEGWLHTGDLGYADEAGEIVFSEKQAELIHFREHQVSPTEIEEILTAHPEVMEAVVVPVPHSTDNHHPMAFVKKTPTSEVTEEELLKFTSKLGESKKLRAGVKFIDEMPRTDSGIIHRKTLKEMAKAHAFL